MTRTTVGSAALTVLLLLAGCSDRPVGGGEPVPVPYGDEAAATVETTQPAAGPTRRTVVRRAEQPTTGATRTVTRPAAVGTTPQAPGTAPDTVSRPPAADDGPASVYYANCAEAIAAGVAPVRYGEPGYRPELDRDGDGTACDAAPALPSAPVEAPEPEPAPEPVPTQVSSQEPTQEPTQEPKPEPVTETPEQPPSPVTTSEPAPGPSPEPTGGPTSEPPQEQPAP